MSLSRRSLLALAALFAGLNAPALAKDGDDDDGGSDNSGSGSSGGDRDDDRDDNRDDSRDEDRDDDRGGASGQDERKDGGEDRDRGDDNSGKGGWREAGLDRAQAAVRAGRIQPLGEILPAVRQKTPGKVLDVTLLRKGSVYRYEVLVLGPSGVYQEVTVDATSRAILSVRKR